MAMIRQQCATRGTEFQAVRMTSSTFSSGKVQEGRTRKSALRSRCSAGTWDGLSSPSRTAQSNLRNAGSAVRLFLLLFGLGLWPSAIFLLLAEFLQDIARFGNPHALEQRFGPDAVRPRPRSSGTHPAPCRVGRVLLGEHGHRLTAQCLISSRLLHNQRGHFRALVASEHGEGDIAH